MKILGIDSSTPLPSAVLIKGNRIVSETHHSSSNSFSTHLLAMVDEVLSPSGTALKDIDGFAITRGPGSFTGLRVGVSLIKGFVLATEKPFCAIDTLEAIAARVVPGAQPVCAVLDARKKEVYTALFKFEGPRLKRVSDDLAITAEALCKIISETTIFIGSGLDTYGEYFSEKLGDRFLLAKNMKAPSVAASAAFLAQEGFDNKKSFDLNDLSIKYIRKPEAELNYAKRL